MRGASSRKPPKAHRNKLDGCFCISSISTPAEKQLRKAKAGPRQRQNVRSTQSRMIIERIHRALSRIELKGHHLPQSALGKAIDYTLTMWPMLLVYLEDGRIEIDYNPVENAIRPTAIGKKNWLFIGEAEAGQRSAILFTIMEACSSPGLDPQSYLREVLTRLPKLTNRQIKDVTPAAWAKTRQNALQRKAA
jgi:transposase